jgi:DNA-binding protein YbaB
MDNLPSMGELKARVEAQRRWVDQLQRDVPRLVVTGRSRGGEVTARLAGTGQFTDIVIDPRVLRTTTPEALGRLVLDAVNDGLARMAEATSRTYTPDPT